MESTEKIRQKRGLSDRVSIRYPEDNGTTEKLIGFPKVVQKKINGRIVNDVVFEVTPLEKMNEGLTVEDFDLHNLVAIGSEPTQRIMFNGNSLDQADNIIGLVDKIPSKESLENVNGNNEEIVES